MLLVTTALLLTTAAPVPKASSGAYHPATVGTKWVMSSGKERVEYAVTAVEVKDGETVVSIEADSGDGFGKGIDTRVVSQDGVFSAGKADERTTFLKLPVVKGSKWVAEKHQGPGRDQVWACEAAGEEAVKVPAGEFRAMRVDTKVTLNGAVTHTMTFWYAAGYGVVKKNLNGTEWVMDSFEPGKK
jgi:hypothetical protein